jgi:hypothetical protein
VLDERDRAILDFEREWWERSGAKEDAIRQTFGLSPARYYQVLGTITPSWSTGFNASGKNVTVHAKGELTLNLQARTERILRWLKRTSRTFLMIW